MKIILFLILASIISKDVYAKKTKIGDEYLDQMNTIFDQELINQYSDFFAALSARGGAMDGGGGTDGFRRNNGLIYLLDFAKCKGELQPSRKSLKTLREVFPGEILTLEQNVSQYPAPVAPFSFSSENNIYQKLKEGVLLKLSKWQSKAPRLSRLVRAIIRSNLDFLYTLEALKNRKQPSSDSNLDLERIVLYDKALGPIIQLSSFSSMPVLDAESVIVHEALQQIGEMNDELGFMKLQNVWDITCAFNKSSAKGIPLEGEDFLGATFYEALNSIEEHLFLETDKSSDADIDLIIQVYSKLHVSRMRNKWNLSYGTRNIRLYDKFEVQRYKECVPISKDFSSSAEQFIECSRRIMTWTTLFRFKEYDYYRRNGLTDLFLLADKLVPGSFEMIAGGYANIESMSNFRKMWHPLSFRIGPYLKILAEFLSQTDNAPTTWEEFKVQDKSSYESVILNKYLDLYIIE